MEILFILLRALIFSSRKKKNGGVSIFSKKFKCDLFIAHDFRVIFMVKPFLPPMEAEEEEVEVKVQVTRNLGS